MSDAEKPAGEAGPGETVIDHPEPSTEAETDFRPFDEIREEFKPGPAIRTIAADGLPHTVDQTTLSDIPALSIGSLVCMADTSEFVVRDHFGGIAWRFRPEDVERMPNGEWTITFAKARAVLVEWLSTLPPDPFSEEDPLRVAKSVLARLKVKFTKDLFVVQPIRPACKHYVRQKIDFELNAQHKAYLRLCSARRTTEGTFMSVRDTGMWACDMRDPRDPETARALDEFDREKMEQGKAVVRLPMFGNQ